MKFISPARLIGLTAFVCFFFTTIFAQLPAITGKVSDKNGNPVAGVSVTIKGSGQGTVTDDSGNFRLAASKEGNSVLLFSFVGFKSRQLSVKAGADPVSLVLEDDLDELEETVVTGVFDKRKRMDASVAITSLSPKIMDKIIAVSAADLLKNVPGVYVNSALGEIRNTVYSRGVSVGSNDGASGYYYVSMQEDGLPVTNATYGNYGPDYFLRPDATLGKLDAVRGGTASILGANAPGGIFNYIMKEGGSKTSGEVRTKYGLEGNGKNPFYRLDVNVGGPLGNNWYYNFGGFYRYAEGARYPGYAMNNGGQFRGNLVKKYSKGSLKIYGKFLNDRNGWFEFTPTVDFSDPRPAEGFDENSSVLAPLTRQTFMVNQTGESRTYDNRNLIHSKDKSFGLTWEHNLGNGWTFTNAARYSIKSTNWNTNAIVYPLAMEDLVTYAILGYLGTPGNYSFRNVQTGQELLNVMSFSGYDFTATSSILPGQQVSKNSLFFEPQLYMDNNMKEFMNQFMISKKLKDMSFSAGAFLASSKLDRLNGITSIALGTIQDRPQLVGLAITTPEGQVLQASAANGFFGLNSAMTPSDARQNNFAAFFGHNWQLHTKLNLDWGVRLESVNVKGSTSPGVNVSSEGGTDNNALTLYDNQYGTTPETFSFNETVSTFSFSAGLNYKINDRFALYGRYSNGKKAPDLDMFLAVNTEFALKSLRPEAQQVQQLEAGVKFKHQNLNLFVTPFYSILSNVPNVQTFQNADMTFYSPPTVYNKYTTHGVEMEAIYDLGKHFNIRGVLTLQKSRANIFETWLARDLGSQDDTLVNLSRNETDNIARSLINITPAYNNGKFFAQLTWSFMGKRQANVANAFLLPSFSQFNFSSGYEISRHFSLNLVVNNLFNKYGVMSWSRPGTFLAALDRQGFTKSMYEDAKSQNLPYSTVAIPARAYFITATFKF